MFHLKGYRTRILNWLGLILLVGSELINLLPELAIEPQIANYIRSGLLVVLTLGNLILRELTNTPAGRRS